MRHVLGRLEVGDLASEIASIVDEPAQSLMEAGQSLDDLLIQYLARAERYEADDRANAERRDELVDVQLVVVKAVSLVPEACVVEGVHGVGDRDEVLEEFCRHVLIRRV